jgi:hypothetical protein
MSEDQFLSSKYVEPKNVRYDVAQPKPVIVENMAPVNVYPQNSNTSEFKFKVT